MARQMLNVEVATMHFRRAYQHSNNSHPIVSSFQPALWLLHIDSDELFFSSRFRKSRMWEWENGPEAEGDIIERQRAVGGVSEHFAALTQGGFRQAVYLNVEAVPQSVFDSDASPFGNLSVYARISDVRLLVNACPPCVQCLLHSFGSLALLLAQTSLPRP
jgi:hypothetical protein